MKTNKNTNSKKSKNKCGLCRQSGHNRRTCPIIKSSHIAAKIKKTQTENKQEIYNGISTKLAILFEEHLNSKCCICMDKTKVCQYKLNCGHYFHSDCITNWINSKLNLSNLSPDCPICRKQLDFNHKGSLIVNKNFTDYQHNCYVSMHKMLENQYKRKIGVFTFCNNS